MGASSDKRQARAKGFEFPMTSGWFDHFDTDDFHVSVWRFKKMKSAEDALVE